MKAKANLVLIFLLFCCSCSKEAATDIRSEFLGDWDFESALTCTPPGTPISANESFEISKSKGSSGIEITFSTGLVLEGLVISKSIFTVTFFTAEDGLTYSATGTILGDGSLDVLLTFSVASSYCVRTGTANK